MYQSAHLNHLANDGQKNDRELKYLGHNLTCMIRISEKEKLIGIPYQLTSARELTLRDQIEE